MSVAMRRRNDGLSVAGTRIVRGRGQRLFENVANRWTGSEQIVIVSVASSRISRGGFATWLWSVFGRVCGRR
jgi:hypothetical protein